MKCSGELKLQIEPTWEKPTLHTRVKRGVRIAHIASLVLLSSSYAASSQSTATATFSGIGVELSGSALASALSQQPHKAAHKAELRLVRGMLTINANDSSLSDIVRDVAHLFAVNVTGEVKDERVYGVYGPGDLPTVLSSLLEGTGTNVIVQGRGRSDGQLILTPRNASPTARRVQHSSSRTSGDFVPSTSLEIAYRNRPTDFVESKRAADRQSEAATSTPGVVPITPAQTAAAPQQNAAPAAATAVTLQRSPNGVKTPDEIKAWLLQLAAGQTASSPLSGSQLL